LRVWLLFIKQMKQRAMNYIDSFSTYIKGNK